MFCVNCGQEIEGNAAFCTSCGSKVAADAPAPKPAAKPLSVEAEYCVHEDFEGILKKAKQCVIVSGVNIGLAIIYMIASFSNADSQITEVFGGVFGAYAFIFSIILLGLSIPIQMICTKNLQKTNVALGSYRAGVIASIVLSAHILGVGIFVSVLLGSAFMISATAASTGMFAGALCLGTSIFISVRGGNILKSANALNRSFKDMK